MLIEMRAWTRVLVLFVAEMVWLGISRAMMQMTRQMTSDWQQASHGR